MCLPPTFLNAYVHSSAHNFTLPHTISSVVICRLHYFASADDVTKMGAKNLSLVIGVNLFRDVDTRTSPLGLQQAFAEAQLVAGVFYSIHSHIIDFSRCTPIPMSVTHSPISTSHYQVGPYFVRAHMRALSHNHCLITCVLCRTITV